jgi:hypothetical protein
MTHCNLERHQVITQPASSLRRNLANVINIIPEKFHQHISRDKGIIAALLMGYQYDAIFKLKSLDVNNIHQSVVDNLISLLENLCEIILIDNGNSKKAVQVKMKEFLVLVMHFTIKVVDHKYDYKLKEVIDRLDNLTLVYAQFI